MHTLRSIADNDELWWRTIRDLYQTFKYRNIMTEDIVSFFNERLGRDLTPIFDQYLRRAALPTLELVFNDHVKTLAYRWNADERGFAMPIRVGTPGKWHTIQPTTAWQLMSNTIPKEAFAVATDHYYVNVVKQ